MKGYIFKRILISLALMLFVAFLIYLLMRSIPMSFVEKMARERANMPGGRSYSEWLKQLSAIYDMDAGVLNGFITWLKAALRGDFGESWQFNVPVIVKFREVIWDSFWLMLAAMILRAAIALPLGTLSARKQNTATDYLITILALIGISLPAFFFATLLKLVFSVKLNWLDLFGKVGRYYDQLPPIQQFLDVAKHYVMPVITLTFISVGDLMRLARANMIEALNSDHIRTVRSMGLPERTVNRHAFRNTLLPLVTLLGGALPALFGGAMITETLFQLPGIGYTAYQAMVAGDIPFTMFYMLFIAALTLIGALLSDILYAFADPRVRVNRGGVS